MLPKYINQSENENTNKREGDIQNQNLLRNNNENIPQVYFIFIWKKENTKDFGHKSSLIFKIDEKHSLY